jgi:Protein of unknown function (DUF2568)
MTPGLAAHHLWLTVLAVTAMSALRLTNVALRGLMEAGIVGALAYWGVHAGDSVAAKVLGVIAPTVGFGIWGAFDFRRTGRLGEPLRLAEELIISALAALALFVAGQHVLAWVLVCMSLLHHGLVYALGMRLLRDRPAAVHRSQP